MEIGVLTLQVHLDAAESLKDKRRVIRSLTGRVRNRYNVAVAEVDHQDLIQLSEIAFLAVAARRDSIDKMFDQILEEAERSVPGDVIESGREYLG